MGLMKRWNGAKWVDCTFKKYDGKSWVSATVKRYNGSSWVNISEQRYVDTWNTTWTRSYGQNGKVKPDGLGGKSRLYQGKIHKNDWVTYAYGIQKSMAGFDYASIRSKLKDSKIEKVEIYLRNQTFWYAAGGKAQIGQHNTASAPATYAHTKKGIKTQIFNGIEEGRWIEVPKSFGEDLRDGYAKGFTLYTTADGLSYYGGWYGKGNGNKDPKIRITYRK